jgi:hypothetical protein
MTLRLITGAANSGKTGVVLDAARAAVVSGVIPAVIVLPGGGSAIRE